MKDLFILVPDKNTEFLLRGLLPRIPLIEGIREFVFDIADDYGRDPAIYNRAYDFLRPLQNNYQYVITILDHEGSGQEDKTVAEIEKVIIDLLSINGWKDRCQAIAISPELENWIWVNQVHMNRIVGWQKSQDINTWLHSEGHKEYGSLKPKRPKEAFEALLFESNCPRSSSLYREIAQCASYQACQDNALRKLLIILREWFHK